MVYETAYIGIATAPNGDFDHFVRQLKTSHLAGGYWRFQSIEDDRRANARGFTIPEDVLCAAESTDEGFDEIFIRWVRGANDPNIRMALSGTPSQHLQTIYELRILLGLPVSSRGEIPHYPISTNPKLRQYWEAKYKAQRPAPISSASQLPGQPIASPVTPRPETLNLSQSQHVILAAPKSPVGRITKVQSKKISQAVRLTPAARATTSRQAPSAPTANTTQSSVAHRSTWDNAVSNLATNAIGQRPAPSQNHTSPTSTSIPSTSSTTRNMPSIPRAALEWGLLSSPVPTPSTLVHGISQHNWVHPSSRNSNLECLSSSAASQQQPKPSGVANHTQDTVTMSAGVIISSNIPYQSPYPMSGTQPGHSDPPVAPSTLPLAGSDVQKHVGAPTSATTSAVHTTKPLSADSSSSSIATPTARAASSEHAGGTRAPESPQAPRDAAPMIPVRNSDEPFSDEMSSPAAQQLDSPAPDIEDAPILEPVSMDETPASTSANPSASNFANALPSDHDLNLQRKLGTLHIRCLDEDDTSARGRAKTPEEMSEPWYTYMKGLEELPCVDCGEDDGHLWDCHLGNIKPMQNLTVLDYRNLTDAVEMFDPGPWTTHFNSPKPEPEDVETQIQGMAEIIRNEKSYKEDDDLHNLPDGFMIMLWAFKTSDKVQVVNEYVGEDY